MIRRIYVHNFRCLENFELPLGPLASVLLIGPNGAGKTTIGLALEVLQTMARGTTRVGQLVKPGDLARGRADAPMRFEIEVELNDQTYAYALALEFPPQFRELRVLEEQLTLNGQPVFSRELAQVRLARSGESEIPFRIDWHVIALPIVQSTPQGDALDTFRRWLANMLVLRPVPSLGRGDSEAGTLQPNIQVTNVGEWFFGLLTSEPAAYSQIELFLKTVMPDLSVIRNRPTAAEHRRLELTFSHGGASLTLPFEELSDGERCFMIYALVMVANHAYGPLLCFWDEPDNNLAPSEVGSAVLALRRAFRDRGQLILTSHNPEAIRRFSDENTFLLQRKSHLEPTVLRA